MSLMQLLAVGESLMGIRNTRSPYRIAREHWLPDFSMEKEQLPAYQMQSSGCGTGSAMPGLSSRGCVGKASEGRLRQGELALEQVQVMRNDLSDSDVEVTWRRAQSSLPAQQGVLPLAKPVVAMAKAAPVPATPAPAPVKEPNRGGTGWNFLMRRVFRSETISMTRP